MSETTSESATDAAAKPVLTYEEAFAQLETILARLEEGDLPLDESLALFEEGSALARQCTTLLDEAELRVRQWQPGDETVELTDWDE